MPLSLRLLHALINHARSSPDEVCGVLIGSRTPQLRIDQIVSAPNIHPQSQRQYLIDAPTLLHADDLAQRSDREIVGFYHSHPHGAAVPSAHDRRDAWPGYAYVIVGFADGTPYVCAWAMTEDGRIHPVLLQGASDAHGSL